MIKLSASAIADFKACPQRFYDKYMLGIRSDTDTDAQRVGSAWHGCLEILGKDTTEDKDELICEYLNKVYKECPGYKTLEEWDTERITLLYALTGYKWFYSNRGFEVVATEIPFEIPVLDPETGRVMADCCLIGRIDKIVKLPNGRFYIMEHKTTSRPIDSGSSVWSQLRLNTQKKVYVYAAQRLQQQGVLDCGDVLITGCFYDYIHKPTISPKKLTQTDSKKFVADGEYCGQKFVVEVIVERGTFINGRAVDVEPGAKEGTFAIRETPEMFGARLLQDMTERPEFYFANREVNCTDDEMTQFGYELYNILRNIKYMQKYKSFYCVESQCEATFKCPFTTFCYNGITEPDVNNLPQGFKYIYGDK